MAIPLTPDINVGRDLLSGIQSFRAKDAQADRYVNGVFTPFPYQFGANEANEWISYFLAVNEAFQNTGLLPVHNATGSTIAAGPVFISGYSSGKYLIVPANAATKKVASAIILTSLTNGSDGTAYQKGLVSASSLDTSGASLNDLVYLNAGGGFSLIDQMTVNGSYISQVIGFVASLGINGDIRTLVEYPNGGVGPQGPQGTNGGGFQGAQGVQGTFGTNGIQGSKGVQGLTGTMPSPSILGCQSSGPQFPVGSSMTDLPFGINNIVVGTDIAHSTSVTPEQFKVQATGTYIAQYQMWLNDYFGYWAGQAVLNGVQCPGSYTDSNEANSAQVPLTALDISSIVAPGTLYHAFDVLTVTGGTLNGSTTQITVDTVDGFGHILTAHISRGGGYSAIPSNPVSVTGGFGSAATFNLDYSGVGNSAQSTIDCTFAFNANAGDTLKFQALIAFFGTALDGYKVTIWEAGATGPQGIPGTNGFQGVQGIQGTNGILGGQGVAGPQGFNGAPGGPQGFTGPQGAGVQGNAGSGFQGNDGPTGSQGNIGPQGTQGTGVQGFTGSIGTTGATGANGLQGAIGNAGVQGNQGPLGPLADGSILTISNSTTATLTSSFADITFDTNQTLQGTDLSHSTSSNTARVLINSTGNYQINYQVFSADAYTANSLQVKKNGSTVLPGSLLDGTIPTANFTNYANDFTAALTAGDYITLQGKTISTDLINSISMSVIRVATGQMGSQGTFGSQGTQGANSVGTQGFTGNAGVQGVQGIQGTAGTNGTNGSQGSTGSNGVQGSVGIGVQGSTGNTGVQGNVGPQGNTGANGIQGATGSAGVQGVKGVQGTTGSNGTNGTNGTQGATGTQGQAGANSAFSTLVKNIQASPTIVGGVVTGTLNNAQTYVFECHIFTDSLQAGDSYTVDMNGGSVFITNFMAQVEVFEAGLSPTGGICRGSAQWTSPGQTFTWTAQSSGSGGTHIMIHGSIIPSGTGTLQPRISTSGATRHTQAGCYITWF